MQPLTGWNELKDPYGPSINFPIKRQECELLEKCDLTKLDG